MTQKTAKQLAEILYRDDLSRADDVPVERDGRKAYDGWVRGAAEAGDSDTARDLAAVDRGEFAAAWEDLAATTTAARALGRKGGAAKTEAQAAAGRENGKKGGRPVEPGSPRWCADAEPGDYLALYEDHDDDGGEGARCGFGDPELDAIRGRLSERGLRLVADHRGLVVEK